MYSREKLLEMITSDKPSERYEACEWLRISLESSPEAIYALEKATMDGDKEVAERARLALKADVHHQMMIAMGKLPPDPVKPEVAENQGIETQEGVVPDETATQYTAVRASVRKWAYWSIGLGVLHLILSGTLNAPWGLLLIIVGLASFYFNSASMLIIYGVTLIWAGISNLLTLNGTWIFTALFQFYLAFRVFLDYRSYRRIENEYLRTAPGQTAADKTANRAGLAFPWIGSILGCISIIGMILLILMIVLIIIGSEQTANIPEYFNFIEGLIINLGILGFAVGLACILSKYRYRILGILGMVAGFLTLAVELAFSILGQIE